MIGFAHAPRAPSGPSTGARTNVDGSRLGYVQGLRAVAVIMVVLYHSGVPLNGGFVGVDVFFVISGFVITALLIRELGHHGRIRFGRFYMRRIRRLLPALSVVLGVTAALSMVLQSPLGAQQDTAVVGIGASTWLANGALYAVTGGYFDNRADSIPLLHTWSLAVEEQFYLVFPILLAIGYWIGNRWSRSLRGVTITMSTIFAVSLLLSLQLSFGGKTLGILNGPSLAFYSAPTRAWEFGAGALIAIWASRYDPLRSRVAFALAALGAVLLLVSATLLPSSVTYPGIAAMVPVGGTALLLAAGRSSPRYVNTLLESRLMRRIGDVSYSWYLWHWPLIVFSTVFWPGIWWSKVGAATLSLPVAWLSFRYLEQPIRRRQPLSVWATPRLALVCIAIPAALFCGLLVGARGSWGDQQIATMAEQVEPEPLGYSIGCHNSIPIPQRNLTRCTFNGAADKQRVLLVGDSNAGQYAEGVVRAGKDLNRTVVLMTMSGCPFLDVIIEQPGLDSADCREFVVKSTQWFVRQDPSIIVMAAANEAIENGAVVLRDPKTNEVGRDAQTKQRIWKAGLTRTMSQLRLAGNTVILVKVIPHYGDGDGGWWTPAQCGLLALRKDIGSCGEALPKTTADSTQARALTAENDAAKESGAYELDLRSILCPGGMCSTNQGDLWAYRDGLHLSTRESYAVGPMFSKAITLATGGLK